MISIVVGILLLISTLATMRIRSESKKELERLDNQKRAAEALLKAIEQPVKKTDIEKGYSFFAEIECRVLGTFYEQDEKYCVVCPVLDSKIIGIPVIGRVSDKNKIMFSGKQTKEMLIKGRDVYQGFKQTNGDDFLDLGRM